MGKIKDLKGNKFNRLTVVEYSHTCKSNGAMWKCVCDCGNTSIVGGAQVSKGYIKSCGCLHREVMSKTHTKHGMSGTPIWKRWCGIKGRCNDLRDKVYGGKGLGYDPRWESFENFYEDMAEGFSDELEIDRIDVTKDYSKENCRWTTHSENNFNKNKQSNNISGKTGVSFMKSHNKWRVYITIDGKVKHLGVYSSFEDAVRVREEAEIKLYGYNRP